MTKKQVVEGYYLTKKYASLERFITYFHQIDEIRKMNPKRVLFIGVGDGLISDYIKKNTTIQITTVDIDDSLGADVIGDVRALPFKDGEFDLVIAFEVLEHIPFSDFSAALKEMQRVSSSRALVSLPYRNTGFDMIIKFPWIRTLLKKDFLRLSLTKAIRFPGFAVSKQHYWEIDNGKTPKSLVRSVIEQFFVINRQFTATFDAYRTFFVLEKLKHQLENKFAKSYYDAYLGQEKDDYVHARWFSTKERVFDYNQTKRAITQAVKSYPEKMDALLEIGPGDGVWTRCVEKKATHLLLLDQSEHMIERAKKQLKDLTHVQFVLTNFAEYKTEKRFDAIFSSRCFEYFTNKQEGLAQMYQLLKKDGQGVIVTKNRSYKSIQPKKDSAMHSMQVTRLQMIGMLKISGFVVTAVYPATFRWKSCWAFSRVFFGALQWIMVKSKGKIDLPFVTQYAVESYTYEFKKVTNH